MITISTTPDAVATWAVPVDLAHGSLLLAAQHHAHYYVLYQIGGPYYEVVGYGGLGASVWPIEWGSPALAQAGVIPARVPSLFPPAVAAARQQILRGSTTAPGRRWRPSPQRFLHQLAHPDPAQSHRLLASCFLPASSPPPPLDDIVLASHSGQHLFVLYRLPHSPTQGTLNLLAGRDPSWPTPSILWTGLPTISVQGPPWSSPGFAHLREAFFAQSPQDDFGLFRVSQCLQGFITGHLTLYPPDEAPAPDAQSPPHDEIPPWLVDVTETLPHADE